MSQSLQNETENSYKKLLSFITKYIKYYKVTEVYYKMRQVL